MSSLYLLLMLLPWVSSLLLKMVTVPPFCLGGETTTLVCDYDSQGEEVYSVKWYKGGQEIFRFLPSLPSSPMTTFPRPGVTIAKNLSNSSMMTLLNVSLASTGRYRCEVSTEAPMFSTESKYGDLLVVILPKKAPVIMGGEAEYSPGDFVHLNCSSFESKPAADLTWTINGKKADGSYVIPHPITTNMATGLHTSTSSLFLTLGKDHFTKDGNLTIKCEATIGQNKAEVGKKIAQK